MIDLSAVPFRSILSICARLGRLHCTQSHRLIAEEQLIPYQLSSVTMMPNIKTNVVLLLLLTSLAIASEDQAKEIDKRAVNELTCAWNAIKAYLPKDDKGNACKAVGDAIITAANIPCVKNAVDPVLDGIAQKAWNFTKDACSWTREKVESLIEKGSNDASQPKAHVSAVLLLAVGGMIVTRKQIF